jgi:hypothetical protein
LLIPSTIAGYSDRLLVTLERRTQTVRVDVTGAMQEWLRQQQPSQPGVVFKTPYECTLIHLSHVLLVLDHAS